MVEGGRECVYKEYGKGGPLFKPPEKPHQHYKDAGKYSVRDTSEPVARGGYRIVQHEYAAKKKIARAELYHYAARACPRSAGEEGGDYGTACEKGEGYVGGQGSSYKKVEPACEQYGNGGRPDRAGEVAEKKHHGGIKRLTSAGKLGGGGGNPLHGNLA